MDTAHKLKNLRKNLANQNLAGCLQPVHDEYMSEYPPACNRRVEWLSGFSGSAGALVILQDSAALFTDGRYTLQAANETDASLFTPFNSGETSPESWLADHAAPGQRIGYDPRLYTATMVRRIQAALEKKGATAVACPNPVDAIWEGRPTAPASPLFIHELRYTGETSASKRARIGQHIAKAGAAYAIIAAPDSVCWLLNIRARDVESTPLALCSAIIDTQGRTQLFIAPERCSPAVKEHLGSDVTLHAPASMQAALAALASPVLCDPQSATLWFTQTLRDGGSAIIEAQDPCVLAKASKNPVELQGIRDAHIRDGVAVTRLLCWIDQCPPGKTLTEIDICDRLAALRAEHKLFVEPSFPTICGSGPNGAIVHYRASPESNRALQQGELLLLDSGGQYPDGTTDITRTIAIGTPSQEQKERFTRVLKGHIAIATACFPEGTSGSQLDALARSPLWQAGLDYDHGTGHGVGHFLGVHEGPQRISKRGGDQPLLPGMIVSNEPGYYKAGAYGIRIESLVAVVAKPRVENTKAFYGFETVTCVPLDSRLMELSLMTTQEKTWVNEYHAWVVSQLTDIDAATLPWLKNACQPLG
jgi:Xaa-Pro aminopeptidase